MFRIRDISAKLFFGGALILTALLPSESVCAKSKEIVLYSFKGGIDGALPQAGLIADASGNLYGTTDEGGGTGCGGTGCGTVFKLAPDGTEAVLHAFQGGADGAGPQSQLIADASGNLYGTTSSGGGAANAGTVFKVAPDGTETILYAFCSQPNCTDGNSPDGNLVMDSRGNLYGTTAAGGITNKNCKVGCGIVFELTPGGIETVLYGFKGGRDGDNPDALLIDGSGNLYGTTEAGGSDHNGCVWGTIGCGTVFEIPSDGTKKTLYTFCSLPNCADGFTPSADLVMDGQGNLYGPTCCGVSGTVIYRLAPNGQETVLHTFNGPPDGVSPLGSVALDKKGNLYGATLQGGSGTGCQGDIGCGSVFELTRGGKESILHSFQHGSDGTFPYGGVIAGKGGNLFGTTGYGGSSDHGTVFEIITK